MDSIKTVIQARAVKRLESIRQALRNQRVSYGELSELRSLAQFIEPGDVELLEPAGVPEFCQYCGSNSGMIFDNEGDMYCASCEMYQDGRP